MLDKDTASRLLQAMIDSTDELQTDPAYVEAMKAGQEALAGVVGCGCCLGDEPLFWEDDENCAFVDSKGEVLVTVKDHIMRFKVKYCPNCGHEFEQ